MSNPNDNDDIATNNENGTNASPSAPNGTEVTTRATTSAPASAPGLPLDWTKLTEEAPKSRLPIDVFEIDPDPSETELTIVGTAGQKITNMGIDLYKYCSPNLTHLVLRSHLIGKMEGLSGFKNLELLELYDNSIEYLEDLGGTTGEDGGDGDGVGAKLRTLDMSYNVIRDMEPVSLCPNLVELYLANNKLKTISGLKNLTKLRKIDLGANRIRIMDEEELSNLTSLEELWLGKNKIETIQGLSKLTKLRRLDVQSNRLTTISNLSAQVDTLEELYLAHNGIDNEGASLDSGLGLRFTQLHTLDLSRNRLTSCRPFAHLHSLEELWISGNDIQSFEDVEPIAESGGGTLSRLEGIYLEYNPIDKEFEYRKKLKEMIPSLQQIDANRIVTTGLDSTAAVAAAGFGFASLGTVGGGGVEEAGSLEKRMRAMQEFALAKARAETKRKMEAEGKFS